MGCWNTSFWDNDECVSFLLFLFQHLGLLPFPSQRYTLIGVIAPPGSVRPLVVRQEPDTYVTVERLLASITPTTLANAKARDPLFKDKLFADKGFKPDSLEACGITLDVLWVLVHMHVGSSDISVEEVDSAAQAFHARDEGGTWNVDPLLKGWTRTPDEVLEGVRNSDATIIRKGILDYKELILRGEPPKPMKLPFLGPLASMQMWMDGHLPGLWEQAGLWNVPWNADYSVEVDGNLDAIKCVTCGKTKKELQRKLMACPCNFAHYCDKDCQKKGWKNHRELHKLRTDP